jgi:hypothetical protein
VRCRIAITLLPNGITDVTAAKFYLGIVAYNLGLMDQIERRKTNRTTHTLVCQYSHVIGTMYNKISLLMRY